MLKSTKLFNHQQQGHLKRIVNQIATELSCEHNWISHGFGFKCEHCDHYTGLNSDLNKLIKAEQDGN